MVRALLGFALVMTALNALRADLRTAPGWYDENAVTTAPDWHFRVPITIATGTYPNSTVKLDVDFAALLSQMGVTGTFDVNSPRIVRSTGALATTQEFTDRIFAGATDATGNGRGEVRFLLQDSAGAAAVTYHLYFDISQNGAKPINPQVPINGNFERGAAGTATPIGWNAPTKAAASYDASVRATEAPSILAVPVSVELPNPTPTDGSPLTGDFSYLYGFRTTGVQAPGTTTNAAPGVTFTRTIVVPATNPGSITFRYRPEGFDSTGWDYTRIDLVGTSTVEMVGPTAASGSPATASYALRPYSPALGASEITATTTGFRAYNTFDCFLNSSVHTLPAMVVPCRSQQWITVTQSLAAFAGQTITFRARSINDRPDQTWYSLDDVEWSVVSGTLGAPQAFGINITAPAPATGYTPGQIMPVTVQVDANPAAAVTPMTVAQFNSSGTQIAGPFTLYNDGTHGDVTAGDAIWSNNGSVSGDAVRVALSASTGTGYILRAFGRDGSSSTIGAQNGLARGPGSGAAAETQANFWNVDEISFNVQTAALSVSKSSIVVDDPVNGTTDPKMIPGARVRYCILVANAGPLAATNLIIADAIPPITTYQTGTMRSGTTCAGATTIEDDDNSDGGETDALQASSPVGSIIALATTLASGGSVALTFEAKIN